jgi:4-diphosphocytidyl-2-C-methyl-D-erythritol kinase
VAGAPSSVTASAPAKVNLVLHVGAARADGLHELCSLIASIELSDTLTVETLPPASGGEGTTTDRRDEVECPGVEGPNLVEEALASFRRAAPGLLPPLHVRIEKRIPVAAGLGGGSADAAAALRAANQMAGEPLDADALRRVAVTVGSDVPGQVEPRHALVAGIGDQVEAVELPAMTLVLVPAAGGLSSAEVYAEADRIGATRKDLGREAVRALASSPVAELATRMDNDLERAALSLRPELEATRKRLLEAGALAARVSGSGPTIFGVFEDERAAGGAVTVIADAFVVRLRSL